MIRAGLASLVLLFAFAAAPVQAQGGATCERLTDAHAYNRCIAASLHRRSGACEPRRLWRCAAFAHTRC
jgi:hypothetical protein